MSQKTRRPSRTRGSFLRLGETGQTIIIVAFAAIALFAVIGLAIDAGRLYITKAELSRSVDAAALSGILEFNGQQSGLDAGENKAEEYFYSNEPDPDTTLDVEAFGDKNEMTVDATKTVKLLFMPVLGIETATVSAHARAGFGTQYLDVIMILDSTPSMAGDPIVNAKEAATSFKNILLGSSPEGNVLVGVTPFRGCFNPPSSASDCIDTSTQISGLSYNNAALNTKISAITASSGGSTSATNVCTGLAKGWEIMDGTVSGEPNHDDNVLYPDNRQFLILLSDGDNAYWGSVSYENDGADWVGTLDPFSPNGADVGGTEYPCMPYDECASPWGGETQTADYPCEDDTINTSARGEIDDNDGSSPNTCNDIATPRERQMDARSVHLAQAIKAQGTEIFVVAFGGGVPYCDLGDTKVYDDSTPADCNSVDQDDSALGGTNGPIGNTDNDNDASDPANTRLLKCIASSSAGTSDHYFFADDDDDLVGIFTQIANQISHRLIE